ncbi:low molecular weight protein arginine phosphatase [Alicyclobacillus ferrooxydans]|uniref:low molecular weight protein arginine phosphatase n=1 Tax=Alicyclobacillus ferrooxydans TaxID=471514 RepID=UPI0006D5A412|nr:low molecular weight protein arginine phosphatase [Alicyclobacillus ferrooxydans]
MHLLFVCTGNTCRSPMAAAMAQTMIAERNLPWTVASAGLAAANGLPMSPLSAQTLTRRHIPLPQHRSSMLRNEMVDKADLILCMTEGHAAQVRRQFPQAAEKVHCLGEYRRPAEQSPHPDDGSAGGAGRTGDAGSIGHNARDKGARPDGADRTGHRRSRHGSSCDIVDPFGGSDEDYEQAARDIESALAGLFKALTARDANPPGKAEGDDADGGSPTGEGGTRS